MARVGVLTTSHGDVETPSYVIVGTRAKVLCLPSEKLGATKTQIIIANTYHLWRELGEKLDFSPGLHRIMGWNGPIMTDSGGFQVFSMGFSREHQTGKVVISQSILTSEKNSPKENLVRVTDDGVYFKDGGKEFYLDAEKSIKIQEHLGADIILAFDEPTSPYNDFGYNKIAMERTHSWAKRCLMAKTRADQQIFGIIQGGLFEGLRVESAKFISSLAFDGIAIGGSFGKDELRKTLSWVTPNLPDDRPRHLLGIGRVEDIFAAVEKGVDTFDCVIPTREARHARLWTKNGAIDIRKGKYENNPVIIEDGCQCPTCSTNTSKGYLRSLFKSKSPRAGGLVTMHNVYFFNNLLEEIRYSIKNGNFTEFKNRFLKNFKS